MTQRENTSPSDIALDPTMPAIDGYRAVLAGLADTIVTNWQGTVDDTDIEHLHDLRIAVRRTRTVLGQAKKVLPPAALAQARAEFARLGAMTGPPRDLDVYLEEWPTYTDGLPQESLVALEPVRLLLNQKKVAAHRELADSLKDPTTVAVIDQWQRWLAGTGAVEEQPSKADKDLLHHVARRITHAHKRLVKDGRSINEDSPGEDLHELRKDAKKLRYMIECFAAVLADGPRKKFVRRLKQLQDNLGVHQDAEVHVAALREIATEVHARGASADTMVAVGRLTERIDQRRLDARAEFAKRFAAYDKPATLHDLERALGR